MQCLLKQSPKTTRYILMLDVITRFDWLTLLHSELSKLYQSLAVLSAIRLNEITDSHYDAITTSTIFDQIKFFFHFFDAFYSIELIISLEVLLHTCIFVDILEIF